MRKILDRRRIERPFSRDEFQSYRTAQLYRTATELTNAPEPQFEHSSVDEVLIADARASLRPAELVERKLSSLLKSVYLPVSHVRTTPLCKGNSHATPLDRNRSATSVTADPIHRQDSQFATSVTS